MSEILNPLISFRQMLDKTKFRSCIAMQEFGEVQLEFEDEAAAETFYQAYLAIMQSEHGKLSKLFQCLGSMQRLQIYQADKRFIFCWTWRGTPQAAHDAKHVYEQLLWLQEINLQPL